jgi:4-amino-4-deoxy-L-arabinose transferase-like glycosyltransferase
MDPSVRFNDRPAPAWPVAALVLIAVGAVLRLSALGLHDFWLDEATTVQFARHDTRGCLLAEVNNPPLERLLVHLWARVVDDRSDAALRVLPALLGALTLPLFWLLARRLLAPAAALVALGLLALNPYHLYFSQELRPYALLGACTVLTLLLHLRGLERPGSLGLGLGLAAALSAGLHTHYQFVWVAAVVTVHRLIAERPLRVGSLAVRLWPAVLAGLSLLPWLLVFLSRVGPQARGYTTDLPGRIASLPFLLLLGDSAVVRQFPETYGTAALRHLWVIVPFCLVALPLLVQGVRTLRRGSPADRFLLAHLVVPLVALAALFPVIPLFTARYLSFLVPATCLLAAAGAFALPGRAWGRASLAGLVALQVLSLGRYFLDPAYGREDWRGAVRVVARDERPGDVILLDAPYVEIPFARYHRGPGQRVPLPEARPDRERVLDAALAAAPRGYLVVSHVWDRPEAARRLLEARRCLDRHRVLRRSHGIEVWRFRPCAR